MVSQTTFNPAEISEKARRDLLRLLETYRGKKNFVIQKSLAGPLGLYVKFSTLQEYGVDRVFFLENNNVDSSQKHVYFLARADNNKTVTEVADQVRRLRHNGQVDYEFSIIWVPRRTLVSDQILAEAGVLGDVTVYEYPLYFVPLADDFLSLEIEGAFTELYLRKDPTCIFTAAKALMLLQQKHGLFPRILGKGDNAKRLSDLLLRMRSELSAGDSANTGGSYLDLTPSQSIESLIIIDREADFPTSLLTQLTYEGLLDEFFGINSNQVDIDSSIIGPATTSQAASSTAATSPSVAQPQSLKRKVMLDSSDSLYSTLRDANCAAIGPLLNKVARRLQSTYESRHTAAKTTADLREFVSKLPGYQQEHAALKLHTNLAEEVIRRTRADFFTRSLEVQQNIAAGADASTQHPNIEELIARDLPLPSILRLLCVYSTFTGGLRARDFDDLRRAILQGYGPQHLITLQNLEKMGLLTLRAGNNPLGVGIAHTTKPPTNYAAARKNLSLIVDEVNESEPDDIAYVFSGYAPLSVRLVQAVLQKSYLSNLQASGGADPAAAAAASAQAGSTGGLGWRPFEDAVKSIRGATVDETQMGEEKAVRARAMLNGGGTSANGSSSSSGDGGKTVIVFFLGGVCRAEVAALRFVAARMAGQREKRKILVCTTNVVTGDGIVGEAIESKSFVPAVAAAAAS